MMRIRAISLTSLNLAPIWHVLHRLSTLSPEIFTGRKYLQEEEVFTIHQRDVDIGRMGQQLFQVHGGIHAAEPAPKNDNLRTSVGTHTTPFMSVRSRMPYALSTPR